MEITEKKVKTKTRQTTGSPVLSYKIVSIFTSLMAISSSSFPSNEECYMIASYFDSALSYTGKNPEPNKITIQNRCLQHKFRFGAILKLTAMPQPGIRAMVFSYHNKIQIYFEKTTDGNHHLRVVKTDEVIPLIHDFVIGTTPRWILIWYELTSSKSEIAIRQAYSWDLDENQKKTHTLGKRSNCD